MRKSSEFARLKTVIQSATAGCVVYVTQQYAEFFTAPPSDGHTYVVEDPRRPHVLHFTYPDGRYECYDGKSPPTVGGRLHKVRAGVQNHHASLPYDKLPAFMKTLQSESGMARYALEFLILCASRTGEVVGAKWEEFDLNKAVWTIPAARMKANIEHRVPLGKRALQILTIIKPFSGKNFVFSSGKKDKAMTNMSMAMLLGRMEQPDIPVHGMRSTFRNWAGECTEYPFQVCEQALAHRLPDAVAAAYLRSDFFVNRVNLMKDWETFALSECNP